MNRPTLVTLARLEACRAGVVLNDLGDEVELRDIKRELVEKLSLRDACGVLAVMRGTDCCEAVATAGGLKVVSAGRRADALPCTSIDPTGPPSGGSRSDSRDS